MTETPASGDADQGARDGNEPPGQLDSAALKTMTPEAIVAARKAGQFDDVLAGRNQS